VTTATLADDAVTTAKVARETFLAELDPGECVAAGSPSSPARPATSSP